MQQAEEKSRETVPSGKTQYFHCFVFFHHWLCYPLLHTEDWAICKLCLSPQEPFRLWAAYWYCEPLLCYTQRFTADKDRSVALALQCLVKKNIQTWENRNVSHFNTTVVKISFQLFLFKRYLILFFSKKFTLINILSSNRCLGQLVNIELLNI